MIKYVFFFFWFMWWPTRHQARAAHAASHQAGAAQACHQSRRPRRWPNQAAHSAIIVVGRFRVCNPNRHMRSRRQGHVWLPPTGERPNCRRLPWAGRAHAGAAAPVPGAARRARCRDAARPCQAPTPRSRRSRSPGARAHARCSSRSRAGRLVRRGRAARVRPRTGVGLAVLTPEHRRACALSRWPAAPEQRRG